MTTLGVFRDDFYNVLNTLPVLKLTSTSQASGTLAAAAIVGATECYITQSGATALTLDTAANVIAGLQNSLIAAGVVNPQVVGLTWTIYIRNTNAGTLTLTAGTGNTITGTATLATTVERQFQVTITGLNTVTYQDLGGSTLQ